MAKLFIEDLDFQGKKVLMRVDFNVPLSKEGKIEDTTRIEASLPSIRYVLDHGGALILMSHLGRPKGKEPHLSLAPVVKTLEILLDQKVEFVTDTIGPLVEEKIQALKPHEVLLLENLRFYTCEKHPEEDPFFAKTLAGFADLYINDAFGTAHRKHSSTYSVPSNFPGKAAAGYLLQKEIDFLENALKDPERPFYALLGGAKISTKLGVAEALLHKVDKLFIGGGMAYTFLKARDVSIGDSLVEIDLLPKAKQLLQQWPQKIILPLDAFCALKPDLIDSVKLVKLKEGIPSGYQGLDIGPETVQLFTEELKKGKTLLWNGPLGVYEIETFAQGTYALAKALAETDLTTIVGGGDLIAAINKCGLVERFSHISTGGGATLEFIEQGTLPGIEALSDKDHPRSH